MPNPETPTATTTNPIVLFDGICALCNGWVDFLLRHDTSKKLIFASLQSAYGQSISPHLNTVILVHDGHVYRQSEAVIRTLMELGGAWRSASLLRLVPRRLRDMIYDYIAAHRYSWFGTRSICRIPTPEERSRFLP